MKATFPNISARQAGRVLRVARSTLHRTAVRKEAFPTLAEPLVMKLPTFIQEDPTYGYYRRLWTLLRYQEGLAINRKAVYRALRISNGWCINESARLALGPRG
ncbi:MAG TPA: hypothetical protein PKK23_06770 [Nitrospirales bacterium]|nr:hypothetical protein [Nitrospirales bacterium]